MVAKRLSDVGGDGQAFRCGGEEFAIVFRNTSAKEASIILKPSAKHRTIHFPRPWRGSKSQRAEEKSSDRRAVPSDRRKSARKKAAAAPAALDHLSVTVSIGVAEPAPATVNRAGHPSRDQASIAPSTKAETA